MLNQMLVSYQNADAIVRLVVRCLLFGLLFPAGCSVQWLIRR
jgi:hypothetical protein